MEKLEQTLSRWRQATPRHVPCNGIRTDPALQPRDEKLVPYRDRHRLEKQSAEHVAAMRGLLDSSTSAQLEPVLLADVGGTLLLVDGHHRLTAYRAQRRVAIPARVLETSRERALLASKLVNLDGAKLPLHPEQRREAAWQYLASVTHSGALPLPSGESLRTVAGRFGIAHSTVSAMLKRLPEVIPGEFAGEACDPGTGWPRWRYLRSDPWKAGADAMQPEQRMRWQAERMAKSLARLLDGTDPAVWLRAVGLLYLDAKNVQEAEALDALATLADLDTEDF